MISETVPDTDDGELCKVPGSWFQLGPTSNLAAVLRCEPVHGFSLSLFLSLFLCANLPLKATDQSFKNTKNTLVVFVITVLSVLI